MKRNKLIIASASLMAALLLFGACGNGNTNSSKGTKASTETSTSQKEKVDLNSLELPQLNPEVAENEALVEMVTTEGNIKIKLFPEQAPKTVENFLTHAKAGYYDGVIFHRVINNFMIQGGDPDGTGMGGESIWGDSFEDEISNQLYNIRGALSMANAGPGTNGSQFFIVQNKNVPSNMLSQLEGAGFPEEIIEAYHSGGTPWLDFRHTVFGHVIEGMDVVDEIASVSRDSQDRPMHDVTIDEVLIEE